MQLSTHFSLEEFTFSPTAVRLGIDNTPPHEIVGRLNEVANRLERVRVLLNYPMTIDSGYRCPELNAAVHGAHNSAHVDGWAIDFRCSKFGTPLQCVKAIVEDGGIEFDQLIVEGGATGWSHISFAPAMRNQILTAHFHNGKATYSEGI